MFHHNQKVDSLTMIHFFPSCWKTGGLTTASLVTGALTEDVETGALNGAGPDRRAVFLCVCMSDVTFFSSIE